MRTSLLILVAVVLAPGVGCKWMDDLRNGSGGGGDQVRGRDRKPLAPLAAEDAVGYLNDRAGRLQSIQYGDVRLRASGRDILVPVNLHGDLAAAQPRRFRLTAEGKMAGKVDLGSNDQQFWMYVNDTRQPVYVFCSHQDFESGKAELPAGIHFEPDWVLQALGMTHFPEPRGSQNGPGVAYTVTPIDRDRTYTLSWTTTTPTRQTIRKEVVFAADPADSTRNQSQVRRHVMKDEKTKKVIASAEIKSAKTTTVTDPKTGQPAAVQYPTHVVLRWEEQKFEMDLTLEQAQVNQPMHDEQTRRLFTRPDIRGTPARDLANAKYEFK
jgi:hypothetical protein